MTNTMMFALLVGYLLGSIPFGLLLTKVTGKGDIRRVGSGNIGATNVLRVGGTGLAAATLVLDAAKGAAAVLIAAQLWPGTEHFAAAGALIGHLYPAWLGFQGGKGVATFLGVLIPLCWPAALVFAIVWVSALLLVRISSVAGMAAALSAPIAVALLGRRDLFPMLLLFALLILWRHHANIARLVAGKEPKIGERKA